ncbi:MAG: M23 family metallopeptidase [candidate division KSB1 bacterium]|nr:M23 family metallopeptidase [candidate division KSB1 bacterium]MDZ7273047.1 M23 family metallopeptidase [candidate division KSB1 bacterium]MDZ7285150.1 M23 family metallopeptidase [candidate division KSB1 bacterium]MDZ7298182.1 M23 family metallopeptidase [candidate division KSB1 bacterium]MDZ7307847.1 M23 family metallopeptidase [candidate division KSB1 bacterium]
MKKKRQRLISVLLIPDDNAEPYNFRLSWTKAKVLMGVAALLVLHMILGVVGYVQFAKVRSENAELERSNTRLLEDNKRVYRLSAQLEAMDRDQGKIMSLLGVDNHKSSRATLNASLVPNLASATESVPDTEIPVPAASFDEFKSEAKSSSRMLMADARGSSQYPANLPTLLPVQGFLSEEFSRDVKMPWQTHAGIDIAGKRGSVVVASGGGHVIFAGWHNEFGNLVIIHHGGDLFSYYGHNDRLLVREKTQVKRGDPIALLGSTGRSSGPHLHFEILQGGKPVDPREFILTLRSGTLQ